MIILKWDEKNSLQIGVFHRYLLLVYYVPPIPICILTYSNKTKKNFLNGEQFIMPFFFMNSLSFIIQTY